MSIFTRIRTWYRARSNAFKAALNTAWQSFVGVFGLAMLGFLADLQKWAGDVEGAFPSVSPLGKAFVSGVAAAASFLVTYVFRRGQAARKPEAGPQYEG